MQWVLPIALGCVLISFVWLSSDIENNSYVWTIGRSSLMARLEALLVVIVCSWASVRLHQFFVRKYSAQKRQALGSLYAVLLSVVIFNLGVLFVSYVINQQGFSSKLVIRSNIIGIPILTIFYLYQRYKYANECNAEQQLLLEQMKGEQTATELDFLRAQYHPHFLFNALNTIYFQIDEENQRAKHSIEMLSDLLRYQIYDIKNQVSLEQEIEHLRTYIEFQKMRMSQRLILLLQIDAPSTAVQLYPLLFQPLIENAFKYVGGSELRIECSLHQTTSGVIFQVRNTIATASSNTNSHCGVGIENLRRRLQLLYPQRHKLTLVPAVKDYSATLQIDINA